MLFVVSCSATLHTQATELGHFENEIMPLLDQYCYDCHGYGDKDGDVLLDEFASVEELKNPHLWQRALNNMRTGLMPPSNEAQPSAEEKRILFSWIKNEVFELDHTHPDPGQVTIRRLNRVDYRNTVKDLFGVDYDTNKEFPADDTGHGFDNIGSVLTISPMLLEKYLDAAQHIVTEAVPSQAYSVAEYPIRPSSFETTYTDPVSSEDRTKEVEPEPATQTEKIWVKKLSYYDTTHSTASMQIEKAGDYQILLEFSALESYVNNQFDLNECQLIFKIDGEAVFDQYFTREGDKKISHVYDRKWTPGKHEFSIEVVPLTPDAEQIRDLRFQINNVRIHGPLRENEWVPTNNYAKYFPSPTPQSVEEQPAYIRQVLKEFATRVFRRPVDDDTLDRLTALAVGTAEYENNSFEKGISQAMIAMLASSRFLFRQEAVLQVEEGEIHPLIDEYALASRLSYFLWSTMPDQELFYLAEKGQLRNNLEQQFNRMLADSRSKEFITNFTGQWLQARDIENVTISDLAIWLRDKPNPELSAARKVFQRISLIPKAQRTEENIIERDEARQVFRAFFSDNTVFRAKLDGEVRAAMKRETEMVFEYVLQERRSASELLDSNYTYLNEPLAKHYGIEGVQGNAMRRVKLHSNSPRGGILTQGTVLAVTSNPTRTSPVKRGVFILDNILGMPAPPPPPNVPSLADVATEEELQSMSLRENLAIHAKRAECRSCHNRMDPLGLALESFNAMGVWRDEEMNLPIEPEGVLITGEAFSDIRELKKTLLSEHSEVFYHCLSEKLLTYALGRSLEYYDTDTLDSLVQQMLASEGDLQVLLFGIIKSDAFQRHRKQTSIVSLHP